MTTQMQSDERRVKEVWPDADVKEYRISRSTTAYRIVRKAGAAWKRLSNIRETPEKSWADAASRLPKAEAVASCWCDEHGTDLCPLHRTKCIECGQELPASLLGSDVARPVAEAAPQIERWSVHYDSMPHTCLDSEHCDCNCEGCVKARGFEVEVLDGLCACGHVDCPYCSRRIAARVMQKVPESIAPQTFEEWLSHLPIPGQFGYSATNLRAAWNAAKALSPDGIGWCSSCDKVHEVRRPKCPTCGDWLIFAADDKPEAPSPVVVGEERSINEIAEALFERLDDGKDTVPWKEQRPNTRRWYRRFAEAAIHVLCTSPSPAVAGGESETPFISNKTGMALDVQEAVIVAEGDWLKCQSLVEELADSIRKNYSRPPIKDVRGKG